MNCPVCQKPVDALRARFVRIVVGQVTAYCSEACKNQDAGAFGDVLATGRSGVRSVVATAVSAVPAAAAGPAKIAVVASAPEQGGEKAAMEAAQSATNTAVAAPPEPTTSVPTATSKSSADAVVVAAAPTAGKAATAKTVAPKKSVSSADIAATRNAAAVKAEGEAVRDAAKALGAAPVTGSVPALAVSAPIANSDPTGSVAERVGAHAGNRTLWMIGGFVIVGVLGGLAYVKNSGSAKPTTPVSPTPTAVVDAAVSADAAVTASAADVKVRALQVLNELMDSKVPRVQRVAAAALARTGDRKAITTLHTLIASEQSALAKLEMSYAIARGGDKSGRLLLQQALTSTGRDQKGDAATLLVQLHDGAETAAVATLTGFLDISQHRLSAAETLAPLRTPAAIKVLDEMAISTTIPADQRSRAIIALAHAGRRDVIPQLTKLLTDPLYNAEAAIALAALGEVSAAPVLREQLRLTSLQVSAARSLRKLAVIAPSALPSDVIVALFDALQGDKDTVRAGAAEVVLLLTGDAVWTEFE